MKNEEFATATEIFTFRFSLLAFFASNTKEHIIFSLRFTDTVQRRGHSPHCPRGDRRRHQLGRASETQFLITGTEDVVMKHVLDTLLRQAEARDELVVGPQRGLKLHRHPCQHGIDALLVHLGEAQPTLCQKQMSRVLAVVQVVGIVHNTLNVAFIVAHLHPCLKNILLTHIWLLYY